jgi:hypothetical protein
MIKTKKRNIQRHCWICKKYHTDTELNHILNLHKFEYGGILLLIIGISWLIANIIIEVLG